MAEALTTDRFRAAMKTLFPEKRLAIYGMENQPFWAYLTKQTDFYGRDTEIPIQYSPGGGGNSPTFEDAQASKNHADYAAFTITRKRDYKIISLDAEAIEASENDKGAYLEATKLETDAQFTHLVQMLGAYLQGDGSGRIGTVTAAPSGNTFTVSDSDIIHFEPKMRVQSAATPFTTLRAGGAKGYMVIGSVNFDTNTITLDVAADTGGDTVAAYGLANADRIYAKGAFGRALSGTEAWIPTDRSGLATPFNGVTRSLFPSRLAGIFFDGSSYGLLECFERAFARARKESARPETVWVSYNTLTNMSLELGAKVVREAVQLGQFGFDSIVLNLAGGKVRFMGDPNFSDTTALATKKDTWGFKGLKTAPRFISRQGGSELILEPAADGFEVRAGWRGEMFCRSPGQNMRITLPAA